VHAWYVGLLCSDSASNALCTFLPACSRRCRPHTTSPTSMMSHRLRLISEAHPNAHTQGPLHYSPWRCTLPSAPTNHAVNPAHKTTSPSTPQPPQSGIPQTRQAPCTPTLLRISLYTSQDAAGGLAPEQERTAIWYSDAHAYQPTKVKPSSMNRQLRFSPPTYPRSSWPTPPPWQGRSSGCSCACIRCRSS
jgi:hypothetical protein